MIRPRISNTQLTNTNDAIIPILTLYENFSYSADVSSECGESVVMSGNAITESSVADTAARSSISVRGSSNSAPNREPRALTIRAGRRLTPAIPINIVSPTSSGSEHTKRHPEAERLTTKASTGLPSTRMVAPTSAGCRSSERRGSYRVASNAISGPSGLA